MNMSEKRLTALILVLLISLSFTECGKPLMCYIAAYSVYRVQPAKFTPDLIDPFLCTHLIYAHLGFDIKSYNISFTDPYADLPSGLDLVGKVASIKKKNPKLKVLFSLGGWDVGSVKFSKIAESKTRRKQLAANILSLLKEHNYDGIDMNWMHPNHRGGKPADLDNYVLLLEDVRKELKKHGFLIVALMSGHEHVLKKAYKIKEMADKLDYILLHSYDYSGTWDGRTGFFAPLRNGNFMSVTSTVDSYLKTGVDREKLLLGFSTAGRLFTADSYFRNDNYFNVPAKESFRMSWTNETGFAGYNEICHELQHNSHWIVYWHHDTSTHFAVSGRKLMSYEDPLSFQAKVKYLMREKLGGGVVWSLDTDDFTGDCLDGKYPLTSTLKETLDLEDNRYVVSDKMMTPDNDTSLESPEADENQENQPHEDTLQQNTINILSVQVINILYS